MAKINRREFLKYSTIVAGVSALSAIELSNPRVSPFLEDAPRALEQSEKIVPTVCGMCLSGCGLNVRVVNGNAVKVEGNPLHPVNQGVCCPKGQASLEVLYSPERLQHPVMRESRSSREWKDVSWDQALSLAATKLRDLHGRGQGRTFAFLFGETRGQMRSLIRRFTTALGSPNAIEMCDADAQAVRLAMLLTQGINDLPVYQWENTRYVLAFGGTFLEVGQHLMPTLTGAGFMRRSTPNRGKLVVVDPRLSVGAAKADEWIPIRPGTFGALALGIANVMIRSNLHDEKFVRDFTFGFDDFTDDQGNQHRGFKRLVLEEYSIDRVEAITGVPSGTVARLAGEFAASQPGFAMLPTGRAALASGNALGTAMAVHALNALVGNIDAPGGVVVQRYPKLAELPLLEPSTTERVDGAGTADYPLAVSLYPTLPDQARYPLNALLLYNANPVFENKRFGDWLAGIPFVASLSSVLDESAEYADVVLPVSTFLESWNDAFAQGTGYAGIAVGQPAVTPMYDTRSAGDALLELAEKIGGRVAEALPFADYQAMLRARVAGSAIKWADLLEKGAWSQMVYLHAAPGSRVWNTEIIGSDRVNAPRDGRFDFFARELFYALKRAGEFPRDRDCLPHFDVPIETAKTSEYPFQLVLQETMTQPRGWSGVVPTLQETYGLQDRGRWDSWAELNPEAAARLGIKDGDSIWIESLAGAVQARAKLYPGLWHNAVAMPLGQGLRTRVAWGQDAARVQTIGANPLGLCASQVEPVTGIAALAPVRVRVYKE